MALNNHKKGQPWRSPFPRRADGGWKDNNLRSQMHRAVSSSHTAEFMAIDGFDPREQLFYIFESLSLHHEAVSMIAERYNINIGDEHLAFLKANIEMFENAIEFIDPEED